MVDVLWLFFLCFRKVGRLRKRAAGGLLLLVYSVMYRVCARVRQLHGDTDRAVAGRRPSPMPGKARSRQRIRYRAVVGLSLSNLFSGKSP